MRRHQFYQLMDAGRRATEFLAARPERDPSLTTPCLAMLTRTLGLSQEFIREECGENNAARAEFRSRNAGYIGLYLAEYCAKQGIDLAEAVQRAEADRERQYPLPAAEPHPA